MSRVGTILRGESRPTEVPRTRGSTLNTQCCTNLDCITTPVIRSVLGELRFLSPFSHMNLTHEISRLWAECSLSKDGDIYHVNFPQSPIHYIVSVSKHLIHLFTVPSLIFSQFWPVQRMEIIWRVPWYLHGYFSWSGTIKNPAARVPIHNMLR
jgi:hypothetical protein